MDMKLPKLGTVLVLLAVMIFSEAGAQEEVILNGGFEDGIGINYGSTADEWYSRGQYWGRFHSSEYQAHSGDHSLHLGNVSGMEAYQEFSTDIGERYLLSYWASGLPAAEGVQPGDPQYGSLFLGAADITQTYIEELFATPTGSDLLTDMGWTEHRYLATATSDLSALYLIVSGFHGPSAISVDDVSLIALSDLTLTWNNGGDGDWGYTNPNSNWLSPLGGATTDYPDANYAAKLGSLANTVYVASPQSALALTVEGGAVEINYDQSLSVEFDVNFAPGTSLTLGAGATLAAGEGGTLATLNAGAGAFVATGKDLTVTYFNAAAGQFTKQDAGTLVLNNVSGAGVVTDPATTVRVEGGMLKAIGADPLDGVTEIHLAGGALGLSAGGRTVAHWSFDNPADLGHDDSGNGHNGVPAGTTVPVANAVGALGGAVEFDGFSWLGVEEHADLRTFPNGMTISLWAMNPTGSNNPPMSRWTWDDSGYGTSSGNWYFGDGPDGPLGSRSVPNDMQTDALWHHYAFTFDPDNNDKVVSYRDGVKVGERTFAMTFAEAVGLAFGVDNRDDAVAFTGSVDEAFIYDSPLSSSEINGLFTVPGTLPVDSDPLDPTKMSAIQVTVSADSALQVNAPSASLGPLTISGGVLTISGAEMQFAGTTILPDAISPGFETLADTNPGPITAGANAIIKRGPADLILDSESNDLVGATFDVQEGRLVTYHGSNPIAGPIAGATVMLNGGEAFLSAKPGTGSPVTYVNDVTVEGSSAISAGSGDAGEPGSMSVVLDGPGAELTLGNAATLTLRSDAPYDLNLTDAVVGDGEVRVDQGDVTLAAGGQFATLRLTGGQLTLGADVGVDSLLLLGGSADTGGNQVTVSNELKAGAMTLTIEPGSTFALSGSDIVSEATTRTLTLSGGLLEVSVLDAPTGAVTYWSMDDPLDFGHDDTGNGHNAATDGTPLAVTGISGGAMQVDGADSIYIADHDDFRNFPNGMTVSVWVKDPVSIHPVLSRWGDDLDPPGTDGTGYGMGWGWWYFGDGSFSTLPHGLSIPDDGAWHQYAFTWDPNNANLAISYKDGVELDRRNSNITFPQVTRLSVGKDNRTGTGFIGSIDEVYIYNKALDPTEMDTLYKSGAGLIVQPDLSLTDLVVEADSTVQTDFDGDALIGDLSVADGVTLAVNHSGWLSVQNLNLGDQATLAGNVLVRGTLDIGASPGTVTVFGTLELASTGTFHVEISENLHDKIIIDGDGSADPPVVDFGNMHGSLAVTGLKPMRDGSDNVVYGDKVLTIGEMADAPSGNGFRYEFAAGVPRSYGAEALSQGLTGTDIVPNLGDPLGPDVYIPSLDAFVPDNAGLWFGGASDQATGEDGVYFSSDKIDIGIFQAAPGDTDGNRKVEGPDILAILTASQFGDGPQLDGNGDSIVVWGTGDFDGNHKVEGPDILLFLTESLFGDGFYGDKGPVVFPAAGAAAEVKLVVTEDGLVIDAGDAKINGFVLRSEAGILTGDDANNIGLFQEDTDDMISGAFAMTLKGEHALGDVIGQTDVDLTGDLTLTYTLVGQPGLFTASVVVPEPGTLMLLLGGLAGLLLWRRRM